MNPKDYREEAVDYYDKFSASPQNDIDFYRSRVTGASRILELGCGTGRVMVSLADAAGYVYGMDHSAAMVALCQKKLNAAKIAPRQAEVEVGDITDFDLTQRTPKFDLIIAPFRVLQNLETDTQVTNLMRCIKAHLAPQGEAILNTFCPRGGPDALKALWNSFDGRKPVWTKQDGAHTVTLTEDCTRSIDTPLTVYPELTYRRFDATGNQLGEATLKIAMRVWYPDDLIGMVESHGFSVTARYGGYSNEPWEKGPELVAAFRHREHPGSEAVSC